MNLMWIDAPALNGTQVVSVEHARSSDYRIYRWMTGRGWEQISTPMNHKQAEEYWVHRCEPVSVSAEMSAWLDAEVAELTRVTGGVR